jgi:RND family efflux transporter MFP subunit
VDVKARVTGFLKEVLFTEGAEVRKGQKLFVIDPEPYIAQFEQAQAQVGLYQAQVKLTTATYQQAAAVAKKNPKTFSALQLRTYKAQMEEAEAGLKAAQASLKIYRINKDYTTVTAPITGVVGRLNLTPENVILQDQTLLTTVVSLDRMYVYFDMDAPTYDTFQQRKQGKAAKTPKAPARITLELPGGQRPSAGEATTKVRGKVNFFNNQFNPATDTILVRGIFPNPRRTKGRPRLRPGMFVRVTVPIGQPYWALLVPDHAILRKMGKKYVYVVGAGTRVEEIPVVIGQLQEGGLRVIKKGQAAKGTRELTAQDQVIVSRLLEIQPKQEIRPVPLPPRKAPR